MSPLARVIYGLWLTGMVFQIALLAVLGARRAWKQFPVFAGYVIFCVFQNALCYSMRGSPSAYMYAYWTTQSFILLLSLAVIYEVFTKLLAAYPALHRLTEVGFYGTVGILLLVSLSVIAFHAPVQGHRLVAGFLVLEQATRVSEVGLLVFLFSFSRIFGLHWRQHVFGIGLGLALFTTVELIGITMRAHFGVAASPVFSLAGLFAYNCGLLVWIGYLLTPERVILRDELPKRAQLEQWNQAVMELIHQ